MTRARPSFALSSWERDAIAYVDAFRSRVDRTPPGEKSVAAISHRVLVLDEPRPDIEGRWLVMTDEELAQKYNPRDVLTRLAEHTLRLGEVRRAIAGGEISLPDVAARRRVLEELHARLQAPSARPGCVPGSMRSSANHVQVYNRRGSMIGVVETAPLQRLQDELEQAFRDYEERIHEGSLHVLEAIAELEGRLLWIHPFADGNGRSALSLSLLLLYHQGYRFMSWVGIDYPFTRMREVDDAGWRAYRHFFLARAVVVTRYLAGELYGDGATDG